MQEQLAALQVQYADDIAEAETKHRDILLELTKAKAEHGAVSFAALGIGLDKLHLFTLTVALY